MKTFQNLLIVRANISFNFRLQICRPPTTPSPAPRFKSPLYIHQINPTLEIEAYFFFNMHRSI